MKKRTRTGMSMGVMVALAVSIWASLDDSVAQGTNERIVVAAEGRGPDVILVPGLASSPAVFAEATEGLDARAHRVTVAGFGGTPAPSDLAPSSRRSRTTSRRTSTLRMSETRCWSGTQWEG